MSINMYIREKLHEHDITQKQLSEMTGITESAISHYIKGDRVPRGINLIKIAKALGTSVDELLNRNTVIDKETDLAFARTLIARNASQMTQQEKIEFVSLLLGKENKNEA